MTTLVRFRSLFLPASLGLLVVFAAGWYNLVWLPSEHKYLDDRNFRLLSTLSEQISTSINNFDKMMDNASESGIDGSMLESYLLKVAPQLMPIEESEIREVIRDDYGDPPKIAVRADEGTHFLYLAFQRKPTAPKYAVRTDLDKLIRTLLPPDNRSPFDAVLVLEGNGTVIFKKSSPGLDVARIDALIDDSGAAKTGKPEPIDLTSLTQSSKFTEITLANARYRLYAQPLQLSLPPIRPERKTAKDKAASPEPQIWVLCGLVRAEAFRSESESISYTYILWFSAAILMVVAAYPFLKLQVSSPSERLRASEISISAVFACVAAATVTFILLDVYHWRKEFEEKAEEQMRGLAEAINKNFGDEQTAAFKQLDEFSKDKRLGAALHEPEVSSPQRPQFKRDEGTCEPKLACRTQILESDDSGESLSSYPYLQFASWSDSKGDQRVKWTTRGRITPFLNLDDGSIPYYPAIKRAIEDPGDSDHVPTKGIGSQYSSNTGDNITIFWKLVDADGKALPEEANAKERKKAFCASLVTRPISVVGPVLPADFQFAIVNGDGLVIYHSDSTRNLHENFFAETDLNQEIRSRVLMRAKGALTSNYMGRGHRLYIRPIAANPNEMWAVIVFRDLRLEQTINLEVLSLATILFLLYALIIALAAAMLWMQRGRAAGNCLWPDSRKAATYQRLAIINGVAILLLLVLSELRSQLALLFCAVFIPTGAMVFNLAALKRGTGRSSSVDAAEQVKSSRWQFGYAGTCATLLAVVAVLPCLSFFKLAWDFEQKLFVQRSQLRLTDDVNARRQFLHSYYQDVGLGKYTGRLLAKPEEQKVPMFSYQQTFLETKTGPPEQVADAAQCGLGRAGDPERCVELFLGALSPLYNQLAADSRYLSEGSSDIWTWSSNPPVEKGHLKLLRKEGDSGGRSVTSLLTPLHIPWGRWQWWMGTMAYLATLFWLVYFGLGRLFLLDIVDLPGRNNPTAPFDPTSLLTKLPQNLVVIGRSSLPIIVSLRERKEVQAYDLYQLLNVPMRRAATPGGGSTEVSAPYDPVEDIVRDGRPVVFYNFERGLEERESNQQKLSTLEKVLSGLHQTVVLTSKVDPVTDSSEAERGQWRTLLRCFVRIDLNSSPGQQADETGEEFQGRISADAYYDWLLSARAKDQKLALVQLAEEKVVNPNSRDVVRELMKEGLVVRRCGILTIRDEGFSQFLKRSVPRESIKHWERQGTGMHSDTLRTSLVIVGVGIAGFLLYTQGAIFNTWITYMTGLAAAVPAAMRMLELFRRSGSGEAQAH